MIRSVINVKGGVGKTTTSLNLAAGFAQKGKRVLLIDMDGQATLSSILLRRKLSDVEKTISDVLANNVKIQDCIYKTDVENLYIVPSNIYLFAIERSMQTKNTGIQQFVLRKALRNVTDFDEIIIDNNPSLNLCSINTVCAAQEVIIPANVDIGALQGIQLTLDFLKQLLDEIDGIDFNYKILITMVTRNNTDKECINHLYDIYSNHVYKTSIRYQASPVKRAGLEANILINNTKANVAADYRCFIDEVLEGDK